MRSGLSGSATPAWAADERIHPPSYPGCRRVTTGVEEGGLHDLIGAVVRHGVEAHGRQDPPARFEPHHLGAAGPQAPDLALEATMPRPPHWPIGCVGATVGG